MDRQLSGTELVAYIDESKKPARDPLTGRALPQSWYAMAAVIVLNGQTLDLRAQLIEMGRDFRPRLHYKELSRSARRDALLRISQIPDWDALVVEVERPVPIRKETGIRRAVLASMLCTLSERHSVTRVVIESRARHAGFDSPDYEDRLVALDMINIGLLPEGFDLTHSNKEEPLLSAADLVVGARTDALAQIDWRPWLNVMGRVNVGTAPLRWKGP